MTAGRLTEPELTISEREELRELRARVRELELEKDILRRQPRILRTKIGN